MTDFVEIDGESVPVVAWKFVIETDDSAGLDEYPAIKYRHTDRETIERQTADAGHEAVAFEPLVSVSDVEAVVDE